MRKYPFSLISAAVAFMLLLGGSALASVSISSSHFPDETFRDYITEEFDLDFSGSLSNDEIEAATDINIQESDITSLEGIEYFTSLVVLDCSLNDLDELDVSKNTLLEELYCDGNSLSSLDVSNCASLRILSCADNDLSALNVSKCTELTELTCGFNKITSLNVASCPDLMTLSCEGNRLTWLNVTGNGALMFLACGYNSLGSLNVKSCPDLAELYCESAGLTALDITNNGALTMLYCFGNAISRLDLTECPNLLRCATEGEVLLSEVEYDASGAETLSSNVYWLDEEDLYCEMRVHPSTSLMTTVMSTPDFTLPSGLTEIGAQAFTGADMTVVLCPNGLKTIGAKAFSDCAGLQEIYIPASVVAIASDAFSGCSGLTIYAPAGSAAATFAANRGFDCVTYTR